MSEASEKFSVRGQAGDEYELAEYMENLYRDSDKRKTIAENGTKRAETVFGYEMYINNIEKELEELCGH